MTIKTFDDQILSLELNPKHKNLSLRKFQNSSNLKQLLSVNALQRYINPRSNVYLSSVKGESKKDKEKVLTFRSLKMSNVSRVEMDLNNKKIKLHQDFKGDKEKIQFLQTSFILANIYKDFLVDYGTKLDSRTRTYPWEPLLSRTIGELKQLLIDLKNKKIKLHQDLKGDIEKRQLVQTSITLANIYKDFPLDYGTKLDYRTRIYPWESLLSRTTGELKQLLMGFTQKYLTINGIKNLMSAYYVFSLNNTLEFRKFLKNNNLNSRNSFKL